MMSDSEYKALLVQSRAFLGLDAADKEKISSAIGIKREEYVKIFQGEVVEIETANNNFLKKNEKVIHQVKATVNKNHKAKLEKEESRLDANEKAKVEKLINQL